MKFAVLGAGAIGGYVGAALARGGADVTLIARGYRILAYVMLALYVLPVMTYGLWRLWRSARPATA